MAPQLNVVGNVWKVVEFWSFFCIFFCNSVTRPFKKYITKAPQKWAAVSHPFLCCLGSPCIAEFVQNCDSEKGMGRGSNMSRALADSDMKQGEKKDCHLQLETSRESIIFEFFVSKQDFLRETVDSIFGFLYNTCSSTHLAKVWVKKRVILI